jgi:hypothetical protein
LRWLGKYRGAAYQGVGKEKIRMEILADVFKSKKYRPDSLSEESLSGQDIVGRLIKFISLTKEDRIKAGIYVGSEGRDWIDRSALVLFPLDRD